MRPATLTVILTTYNHEAFVAQALESVLAQETDVPFDVVVIDDVVDRRDARHRAPSCAIAIPSGCAWPSTTVNENSNRRFRAGVGAAASSAFVALLDGDDFWTAPTKLGAAGRPCSESAAATARSASTTSTSSPTTPPSRAWRNNGPQWDRPLGIDDLWARNPIPGCSPVLRRSVLPRLPRLVRRRPVGRLAAVPAVRRPRSRSPTSTRSWACTACTPAGVWSRESEVQRLVQTTAFLEDMARADAASRRRHRPLRPRRVAPRARPRAPSGPAALPAAAPVARRRAAGGRAARAHSTPSSRATRSPGRASSASSASPGAA